VWPRDPQELPVVPGVIAPRNPPFSIMKITRSAPARRLALTCLAGLLLGSATGLAQDRFRWPGTGGWSATSPYVRQFDTNSLVSLRGWVIRSESFRPGGGASPGVRAIVQSGADKVTVHLGPRWFMERQELQLQPKDPLAIEGSRVPMGGESVIIARAISVGERSLVLRDAVGSPVWSADQIRLPGTRPTVLAPDSGSTWTLQLPEGKADRGRAAFNMLWCHGCHVVKGYEKEFEAPHAQPAVPVVLGMETRKPSRMELVNSIINPSHRIEPGFQRNLVTQGKFSRMGDYNETLTLQQLSDLVAFLESLQR
jgi:hypothetical protein